MNSKTKTTKPYLSFLYSVEDMIVSVPKEPGGQRGMNIDFKCILQQSRVSNFENFPSGQTMVAPRGDTIPQPPGNNFASYGTVV